MPPLELKLFLARADTPRHPHLLAAHIPAQQARLLAITLVMQRPKPSRLSLLVRRNGYGDFKVGGFFLPKFANLRSRVVLFTLNWVRLTGRLGGATRAPGAG